MSDNGDVIMHHAVIQPSLLMYKSAKEMHVSQLREEMKQRGFNPNGSKKKLLNRIKYYSGRGISSIDNKHVTTQINRFPPDLSTEIEAYFRSSTSNVMDVLRSISFD